MALAAHHKKPAGAEHLLAPGRDLGADLGGGSLLRDLVLFFAELVGDAELHVAAELDIGAAAGHVGGDGERTRAPRLRDDVRLLLVIAGVEHVVGNRFLLQPLGQELGLLDAGRADQHRLPPLLAVLQELDDRVPLLVRRAVDLVVAILADAGLVGGDLDHVEAVDVAELGGLGRRGAGHAGELRIHAEVVLEGDRGQRLVLLLDPHMLLGLQRLVQPFREAAPRHHAPGELVDDDDAPVLDDVVGIALEHLVGADRLVQVMDDRDVLDVVEVGALQQLVLGEQRLDALGALVGERRRAGLLVDLEVALFEVGDHPVDLLIHLRAVLGRP